MVRMENRDQIIRANASKYDSSKRRDAEIAEKSAGVIKFQHWNGVVIILWHIMEIPYFSAKSFAFSASPRFDSVIPDKF
jgi:hypothetical protein